MRKRIFASIMLVMFGFLAISCKDNSNTEPVDPTPTNPVEETTFNP